MRHIRIILVLACAVMSLSAQEKTDGPTSEKAQKTYNEGLEYVHQRAPGRRSTASRRRTSRTAATARHVSRR